MNTYWSLEKDTQLLKSGQENFKKTKVSKEVGSLAMAVLQARFLYLERDPKSFSNIPINPLSKQLRKRHCLRFVGDDMISQDTVSKLPRTFFVSPTSCSFEYSTTSQLASTCTVVDSVQFKNEWWIYIQSSKPTKTFTVCNFIYNTCMLDNGCFFTDEIPGGRGQTKRYEFTKLQHFKHCIAELQVAASQ